MLKTPPLTQMKLLLIDAGDQSISGSEWFWLFWTFWQKYWMQLHEKRFLDTRECCCSKMGENSVFSDNDWVRTIFAGWLNIDPGIWKSLPVIDFVVDFVLQRKKAFICFNWQNDSLFCRNRLANPSYSPLHLQVNCPDCCQGNRQ